MTSVFGANPITEKNILIIGAGYLGRPVAEQLRTWGNKVVLWVRSLESKQTLQAQGFEAYAADVTEKSNWKKIGKDFHDVIYMPSTRGGTVDDYRKLYVQGLHFATEHFPYDTRILFLSSTSVYPQQNSEWVDETSPTDNTSSKPASLLAAEQLVLQRDGSVIRLSGIYGPGRCAMLQRLLHGRPLSVHDAQRWLNQIHRDDAISAILHVLTLPRGVLVNATDSMPVKRIELYAWLAKLTGLPQLPLTQQPESRQRGNTNKRVSNKKLLSLGWILNYPTYELGYRQLLDSFPFNQTRPA